MTDAAHDLQENYFYWLVRDSFLSATDQYNYEGMLRCLHDIPFYWSAHFMSDSNRAGDALSHRQSDFMAFYDHYSLDQMDQVWLGQWATAAPSFLEVIVGMARRWSWYFERPVAFYTEILLKNLDLGLYVGRQLPSKAHEEIRQIADNWMSRQFAPNGVGSPFPITYALDVVDLRTLDIWGQMNAYSAEHFQ